MVGRALSDQVKKQKKAHSNERLLQQAAIAYLEAKEHGEKPTLRGVAKHFSVSKSGLKRFIDGEHRSIKEFNASKQKSPPAGVAEDPK
ncbi:hypothetical protein H0H87_009789, partial [Tephrocybe sp. NHM501043]